MAHVAEDFYLKHFYKYVTHSTGVIVLRTGKLRWSSPTLFNDVFDNQIDLQFQPERERTARELVDHAWRYYTGDQPIDPTPSLRWLLNAASKRPRMSKKDFKRSFAPVFEELIDKLPQHLSKFNADIRRMVPQHKILCLSTNITSILMWSYYAEGHKGLALRFRSLRDSPWRVGRPVAYSDSLPRLFTPKEFSDLVFNNVAPDHTEVLWRLVSAKSSEWKHEHEWRLFAGTGRNAAACFEDIPFNRLELDGIIFGARLTTEERLAIRAIARDLYPHSQFLSVATTPASYRLQVISDQAL